MFLSSNEPQILAFFSSVDKFGVHTSLRAGRTLAYPSIARVMTPTGFDEPKNPESRLFSRSNS